MLLLDFSQLIFRALNDRKHVLVLFVDYSTAFDLLNHRQIVQSMENIGITGKILKWFTNYLKRTYNVKLWDKLSPSREATGVPQGSVLGPLLYLIYTNQINIIIPSKNPYTHVFSYADDMALVVVHDSIEEAEIIMQNNFNFLLSWSRGLVSTKKTKILYVRSSQYPTRPINLLTHSSPCLHTNLSLNLPRTCQERIENVTEFRYLEVWIVD